MKGTNDFEVTDKPQKKLHRRKGFYLLLGIIIGIIIVVALYQTSVYFSTNESCMICHVHPHAEETWKLSILFSPDASVERKKRSLSLLASIPDVTAYRAIETYHSSPLEPELKNWSAMALVSSRIVLNSNLSGKQQVYISSGLGGHDKKLRFFALFTTQNRENFTDLQKNIIESEFRFQLEQADVDIEKFEIEDNYFTILMLVPFDVNIKSILQAAIDECNQYGNFLDTKFLFTNVKILGEEEITNLLKKKD